MAEENEWYTSVITETVRNRIGVATNQSRLSEDDFAASIIDRLLPLVEGRDREVELLANYIAGTLPEDLRLNTTVSNLPWVEVVKSIPPEALAEFAASQMSELGLRAGVDELRRAQPMAFKDFASEFLSSLEEPLRNEYQEMAAANISSSDPTGQTTPEQAVAAAEALPDSTLTDSFNPGDFEDQTIESSLATQPGVSLSDLVARDLQYETPPELSMLPGFNNVEVADEFTAADALSYIVDIDSKARKQLQKLLEDAGYFDTARSMGHISARDGTVDTATQIAWETLLGDAALNGQTNVSAWLDSRMRTMSQRSMASVQEVYRDPAEINTLIDSMSFSLLGRIIEPMERQGLMAKLMEWQRESLLGPTYTEERYDVDLQARAKEYFDKNYQEERMTNRRDMFRQLIGELDE